MKIFMALCMVFVMFANAKEYTIALISDGKSEYSQEFENSLKAEIVQILGHDYKVVFPKKLYRDGQWNYTKIAADINKALKDPRSDMVITLGALSSHYIARKHYFAKPVVATAVINPKMQKIPYKEGMSYKHNLTYVSGFDTLQKDIEAMKDVKPLHKVAVLIDGVLVKNTPEVGRYISKMFAKKGIAIEVIAMQKDLQASLQPLSGDVDFVYVTPLFQYTKAQKKELYEILASRELASFAVTGEDEVELGALCANAPKTDTKRFIRQIALDVQQIVLGSNASQQLVNFTPTPAFSINMATAKEIGYTPKWELLSRATIINSQENDSHYFTIEEIMDRAIGHNLHVVASEQQTEVSSARLDGSQSAYYPQIVFGAEAVKVDEDRAVASLGLQNETTADMYLKFRQQLFNHKASARISVNEHFLQAQQSATDFVKLDIGLSASLHYLRVLQLRTKLEIEKSNLELSKTNMRSAMIRRDIGIGSASDIYRWQTQIADEKKRLLFTHTELQKAKHALNSLLNLPQDLPLNFDPVDMNNEIFMTSNPVMKSYFIDQTKFDLFESFLVKTAKENMPSLDQYQALEYAKSKIVESNKDAFYLPKVFVGGEVKQHFISASNSFRDSDPQRFGDFPYADNTDWSIGLFLEFPLYLGGSKQARLDASKAALRVAQAQKEELLNEVEKNVRDALYQAKASYLSIKLAQDASISSKKNLELIKGVYAQGNIGIIDLLDAQHTALRAALLENNSRYAFMRDLLILQHDIGQVNFNLSKNGWQEWIASLQNYKTAEEEDEDE